VRILFSHSPISPTTIEALTDGAGAVYVAGWALAGFLVELRNSFKNDI
jgi:hypothetical protein